MNRHDELMELIPDDSKDLVNEVVEEIIFLEDKLEELKKLPFLEIHPKDNAKQRNTPASKMYKELLQQYINCIKVVEGVIYRDKRLEGETIEDSPLRKWFKDHADS